MRTHARLACLALMALGMAATGCTGFRWGAGNEGIFKSGSLMIGIDARPDQVIVAAEKAFRGLQWECLPSTSSLTDGQAYARTGEGNSVRVTVKLFGTNRSTVTLHVGTWGDEGASRLLLTHIRAHLGLDEPTPRWPRKR